MWVPEEVPDRVAKRKLYSLLVTNLRPCPSNFRNFFGAHPKYRVESVVIVEKRTFCHCN